uniref:TraB family protein n=1 Tax=viral metagenome TaxID=1070528 RepID=A0A6C0ADL4_9ZZZZ
MFFDSINEEKEIKECKWYEISAGFMYDCDYLETLSKRNYFIKNLGKVNIKNINFTEIAKFQLCTTNFIGIDHHLAYLFLKKSSDINSLDENNSEIVGFFQNYLKFILYSILFIKRIFGQDIKDFNINTDTNIELIENSDKITINKSPLVNKRNELWIPKIRNEIQKKTLIVVGTAHVKEIVEKFKHEGYKIEKYNYILNKFTPFRINQGEPKSPM